MPPSQQTLQWIRPIIRLAFVLILTPGMLTYLHIRGDLNQSEMCFVGPTSLAPITTNRAVVLSHSPSAIEPPLSKHILETANGIRPEKKDLNSSTQESRYLLSQEKTNDIFSFPTMFGMYRVIPGSQTKKKRGNEPLLFSHIQGTTQPKKFRKFGFVSLISRLGRIFPFLFSDRHWPSVHVLTSELASVSHPSNYLPVSRLFLKYYSEGTKKGSWCAVPSTEEWRICSDMIQLDEEKEKTHFPPTGIWNDFEMVSNSDLTNKARTPTTRSIEVSCPGSINTLKKEPKRKFFKNNKNIKEVIMLPATSLLILLNIYLAFRYWNDRVSPSAVSKNYNRMVSCPPNELWRAYTGSFAHFDLLHLGFNMMTLYSIGMALEKSYGSIPFLFSNLSLIPLITICMLILFRLQMKHTQNPSIGETNTVGYSGVLFAWIVVTAVRNQQSCPVPFLPNMCFSTYSLMGGLLQFNVAPVIQLFLAQMIMPRVSFVGHLSGIICGFVAIQWGILPLAYLPPQVLIPGLSIAHFYFAQKIVPVRDGVQSAELDEEDGYEMVHLGEKMAGSTSRGDENPKVVRAQNGLSRNLKCMAVVALLSLFFMDVPGITSQILSTAIFTFAVQAHANFSSAVNRKSRCSSKLVVGILLRAYVISSILILVTDAMTGGSWIVARTLIKGRVMLKRGYCFGFIPALIFLFMRTVVNMAGLILASKVLGDLGEIKTGIFVRMFGFVLNQARSLGDLVLAPVFTPFQGQGALLKVDSDISTTATSVHVGIQREL